MLLRPTLTRLATGRIALGGVLAGGIGLRLLELLRNRSLRWDEASLALNILHLPFARLFGPLEHDQVAPPLFLVVEKALAEALGSQELVLRVLPFLLGIAALFLFATLSRRILGDGPGRLLALGLFVITDSLVFYSADAKPYSGDVAACLWIWLCALRFASSPDAGSALVYGVSGALLPWFSHAVVFVVGGTGAALVLLPTAPEQRRARTLALIPGGLVFVSLVNLYLFVLRHQTHKAVLDGFWSDYFAPLPPTSLGDLKWYVSSFFGLFTTPFGDGAKLYGLTAFTMLLGLAALARKQWRGVILLVTPAFLALLASGMHLYPFHGRLLTFLVPVVWLAVGAGALRFRELLPQRDAWTALLLVVMLCGHPLLNAMSLLRSPRQMPDFRTVAEHLRQNRREGDQLYLSHLGENPVRYYAERSRLDLEPLLVGTAIDSFGPEFHRDLERLRGRGRVWFVFDFGDPTRMEADVAARVAMARLEESGRELDRLDVFGVRLCLFDLDSMR
ncbi:MAG: hypothetical protein HOP15_02435 [Planctomycetes bacterium]|nr:hypothetical protein [Planctomycetota bacterium]